MPKKKQKPNPFLLFMLELRNREEAKGRKFRSLDDVKNIAGPIWEKMSADKRAPYVVQASKAKLLASETYTKLNGVGLPISMVQAEMRNEEEKNALIKCRLSAMISDAVKNDALKKMEVFFLAFEYFCELSDGRIVPAELAAVRYSLGAGVMDSVHTLIDPGSLPVGYALAAQNQSASYHKLPVPPNALGEKSYETIALRLFEFLSKNGDDAPLLFTNSYDLSKVETMLYDIAQDFLPGLELLVCPLSELFYQLKKATWEIFSGDVRDAPTIHALQSLIDRDVYDFASYISCEYHEQLGNGKYCALSRCVRWAYVISDSCCIDLSIPLKPGKHIPPDDGGMDELIPGFSTISFTQFAADDKSSSSSKPKSKSIFKNDNTSGIDQNPWVIQVHSGEQATTSLDKKLKFDDFPALGSCSYKYK